MPADFTKKMTPATIGQGVHDLARFRQFAKEEAAVTIVYEDEDQTLVVWNLEPGQENAIHVHPTNAHTMMILEGEGQLLRGDGGQAAVKTGDCLIVPRTVLHGIRNTGRGRLSYLAVTTNGPQGYVKQNSDGSQVDVH
ncbi:MAG: cupin domain-containing protein [Candidatus Binataceae bacterium]|nr:cupin domain-containing protein [Candidatus Binataceae bacterium]